MCSPGRVGSSSSAFVPPRSALEAIRRHATALLPVEARITAFEAEAAHLRGDFVSALSLWQSAIRNVPAWARARRGLAEACLELGDAKTALIQALEAVRLAPDDAHLHALVARITARTNDASAARAAWLNAARLGFGADAYAEALKLARTCAEGESVLAEARPLLNYHFKLSRAAMAFAFRVCDTSGALALSRETAMRWPLESAGWIGWLRAARHIEPSETERALAALTQLFPTSAVRRRDRLLALAAVHHHAR